MKNIISIMLIAAFGVMLMFTGCKEEEETPDPLQMVTVSGTVECELDLTNANAEDVPNGIKLVFRINSRDLVQNPIVGYTYQVLQYEATVSDGTYSIQLPTAVHAGVPVTITPVDFQAEQTQLDNSEDTKTYMAAPIGIATQEGERYFENITYGAF